jgi:hypothetical protein
LRLIVVIQGSDCVTKANNNEWWFAPLFRIVGYALLALSLFDIVDVFVPPLFTNPAWEFQMVRSLVERVPVPLLGAVLVFSGEKSLKIFKVLSWACLIAGMLFFLLIPLGINAGWRLDRQSEQELTTRVNQQANQLQQLQAVLNKATTPAEIQSVLTRLNPQAGAVPTQNVDQLKTQLLTRIADGQSQLKNQAATNRANAQRLLIKNIVKSVLGALVSGTIFILIWRQTTRALKANRQRA